MAISDSIILISGVLLMAGVFSNKISAKFNLPTLLLFLGAGIVAELLLPFNGDSYAHHINFFGIIAMCFILFSGGCETSLENIRPVALRGLALAVPGVILTALLIGSGAYFALGGKYPFSWCMLLGSIISSTDAAAVFSILRGQGVGLKGKLKPLLEFESGSNDPTAAFLTLLMINIVLGKSGNFFIQVPMVIYQLGGGILLGYAFGKLSQKLYHIRLAHEGLYFVTGVACVLLCYGISQLLRTNGFMACYVCGVMLNSARYNYQKALTKFYNGIAWLMQVGLFTVLGFLANPEDLIVPQVWVTGIVLGLLLMFIARPVAVFICLAGSEFSFREKLMVSWVGIRGAAPIVLATFPLAAGVENADFMFRIIFFMVIISILLQGGLLMPVARWLKVAKTAKRTYAPAPLELEVTHHSGNQEMREFHLGETHSFIGKTLAQIALPQGVLVTMIRRNNTFIPPRGDTEIKAGDGMLIMAEITLLNEISEKYFKDRSI